MHVQTSQKHTFYLLHQSQLKHKVQVTEIGETRVETIHTSISIFLNLYILGCPLIYELLNFNRLTHSTGLVGHKNNACKIFFENNEF